MAFSTLSSQAYNLVTVSLAATLLTATPCEARMPSFLHFCAPIFTTTTITTTETTQFYASSADSLPAASGPILEGKSFEHVEAPAVFSGVITALDSFVSKKRPGLRSQNIMLASSEVPLSKNLAPVEELGLAFSSDDVQQDEMDFFPLQDSVPIIVDSIEITTTQSVPDLAQLETQHLSYESSVIESSARDALADPYNSEVAVEDESLRQVYQVLEDLNAIGAVESAANEEEEDQGEDALAR
jgi:hypothetical protein